MENKALVVMGLMYGDEGKGKTVNFLAQKENADRVIRFSGGAQAAHNVTKGNSFHTFSQWGAATFQEVPTYLYKTMLLNPLNLLPESEHLKELINKDPFQYLHVHEDCLLTTPFQMAANRIKETYRSLSGVRHGSCGLGIGETIADFEDNNLFLKAKNLREINFLYKKVKEIQATKHEQLKTEIETIKKEINPSDPIFKEISLLEDKEAQNFVMDNFLFIKEKLNLVKEIPRSGVSIFEGSQGALLDQDYGFFPHVTRTKTNAAFIEEELKKYSQVEKWGVTRTYATRHGQGPLVTESADLKKDLEKRNLTENHNQWGPWQQGWRVGYLDLPALRYGQSVLGKLDRLSVTWGDALEEQQKVCTHYILERKVKKQVQSNFSTYVPEQKATANFSYSLQKLARPNLKAQECITRQMQVVTACYENMSKEEVFEQIEKNTGVSKKDTIIFSKEKDDE